MTIEELRYFVKAANSKSFSEAAEKLFISPQGMSQGIRHLYTKIAGASEQTNGKIQSHVRHTKRFSKKRPN